MRTAMISGLMAMGAAVLAAFLALAIDDGSPPAPALDAEPAQVTFDPAGIFSEVGRSVVAIEAGMSGGTGFFIDAEGHIVTNYHVVQGLQVVDVILADGRRFSGRVLGFDNANDLAIVAIDADGTAIHPVRLGDSDALEIGEPVAAIGNPFGLERTLTTGIVSGAERTGPPLLMGGRPQRGLIQTDAAINPGNSGGPLINAAGEVVGINASARSPVAGSVGVNFAIPVNTLRRFLPDLIADVEVLHPWVGINVRQLSLAEGARLSIGSLAAGGPAARAGLRPGDEIAAIDGVVPASVAQVSELLDAQRVGKTVIFEIVRDGERLAKPVQLAAWPS